MVFIAFYYDGTRGGKRSFKSNGFRKQIASFDLAGTFTFMSATICLLAALETTYATDDARIIALLTVAGVLYCSFVGVEYLMRDGAIIPLRLLRRRSIIAAIWFALCLGGVFFVRNVIACSTFQWANQDVFAVPGQCFLHT